MNDWTTPVTLTPIGVVRSPRVEVRDDDWGDVVSTIELDAERFGPEALAGLDAFSHVEVLFHMNQIADSDVERGARHPRGRRDWPVVGIFAQRAKWRPNRIGATICRVAGVDGLRLTVEGLDAIDGTPVLDVKPFMMEFAPRGDVRQPDWATELMSGYW